jgi:hypothetical protein
MQADWFGLHHAASDRYLFARSIARSSCALLMPERPSILSRFAWL